VSARHGRAQIHLHFTVKARESNRANAIIAFEDGYARRVVDAWLRGTKVNLPLTVPAREAFKARARVGGHVLGCHADASIGALHGRGPTRIRLNLAQNAREARRAHTLKSVPAGDALRAVSTRRRGTVVDEELTAWARVRGRTAALTLPAATAVHAWLASHCG
jgi:hypothetical protein